MTYPVKKPTSKLKCGGTRVPPFLRNYKLFVTRQEIGEKNRIKEIGIRWDTNVNDPQMYY